MVKNESTINMHVREALHYNYPSKLFPVSMNSISNSFWKTKISNCKVKMERNYSTNRIFDTYVYKIQLFSFMFKTKETDGLILYNGGEGLSNDFFAVCLQTFCLFICLHSLYGNSGGPVSLSRENI